MIELPSWAFTLMVCLSVYGLVFIFGRSFGVLEWVDRTFPLDELTSDTSEGVADE